MKGVERAVLLFSRLVPVDPPGRLVSFFAPRLESAMLLVSPAHFAKFSLAVSALSVVATLVALTRVAAPVLFPVLASLLILQVSPLLILAYRAHSRRRSVDGELPFFAMLLFILSHQSVANLPEAFAKAGQLGQGVFPALYNESETLRRNLAYSNEPEQTTVERTFRFHPSRYLRELVRGYLTTLSSGRDVHEFVRDEADRLLAVQEERWRSFSIGLSSMTEVSFIFLAIFPVGIQMVAGGFAGGRSSALLVISTLVLTLVAVALLLWMDSSQPVSNDGAFPAVYLAALVLAFGPVLTFYYLDTILSSDAAFALLGLSMLYVVRSRPFFKMLRAGEEEVASMLHDLTELTRAGVELPSALSKLLEDSHSVQSLREPLSTFAMLISLGRTPVAAQKKAAHPSWLVRISFALLAVAFETGGGYEQLERLSSSFRRVSDSRRSARASVLPFVALGVAVPALSAASFWFLRSMQAVSPGFHPFSLGAAGVGTGGSILACTLLTGLLVSKAYSQSVRSALGLPPLLASAFLSLLIFGSP